MDKSSKNIILIGMPGSGKSTVGPLLAERTGMSFEDTDEIIQRTDGRELRDIVKEDGYERFLELQQEIIMSQQFAGCVVATGGGAVKSEGLMQYLKTGAITVFLDETLPVLESRLAAGRRLARTQGQSFGEVFKERRPLYIKYADIIIECSGKTVEDIVREIINNG